MQISVWSNMHGQAAVSATTAAIASTIAQKTSFKTLVAHNHLQRSALENYLFKDAAFSNKLSRSITNQGVDALLRLMKNGRLKAEMVADYTYSILKDHRMDILLGTTKKDRMANEDFELILEIIECAKEFYDVVLIDVHSGLEHNNCINLLKSSDVIVFCINQNIFLLNDLMQLFNKHDFLKETKSAYVISRYEKNAGLTRSNLARRFKLTTDSVFYIPNSSNFADALNSGRIFEYIAFNQNTKEYDENAITSSFNKLCNYLVEGCRTN